MVTHLRVYERQGPIKFARAACIHHKKEPPSMTDKASLVSCSSCKHTRFYTQALRSEGEEKETGR